MKRPSQSPKYDDSIDDAIFTALIRDGSLGYNDLKRAIEKILERSNLSPDTFTNHIKRLLDKRIISKKIVDEGKENKWRVVYSMTDRARKEYQLGVLSGDKNARLRKLYASLLFYENMQEYATDSQHDEKRVDDDKTIKRRGGRMRSGKPYKITFESKKKQTTSYSIIDLFELDDAFYPRSEGFSLKEFLERDKFGYDDEKFTEEEVQQAFSKLMEAGLIKRVSTSEGQPRYVTTDPALRDMIRIIWRIHNLEWHNLLNKWMLLQRPSKEERIWVEKLYGKKHTDKIFAAVTEDLSRHRAHADSMAPIYRRRYLQLQSQSKERIARRENEIQTLIAHLKKKYGKTLDFYTNLHEIIGIVCPRLFENPSAPNKEAS